MRLQTDRYVMELCRLLLIDVLGRLFFFGRCFFFQAEDGIRDLVRSRGLGDVYKRQSLRGCLVVTTSTMNTLDYA